MTMDHAEGQGRRARFRGEAPKSQALLPPDLCSDCGGGARRLYGLDHRATVCLTEDSLPGVFSRASEGLAVLKS